MNGGLRDKPSKGRDFYHSCYCLSGLSVAQHYGGDPHYCSATSSSLDDPTTVATTHPCYNIQTKHVARLLRYFADRPLDRQTPTL